MHNAPVEPVLYVDDARYARLWSLWKQISSLGEEAERDATAEARRLIYREARLLDDRQYDPWLGLFAPDCLYWIPRKPEPGDPRTESGIYLDDRRRMMDRVAVIRTGYLHAQTPASRTRRMLSGIEAWATSDGGLTARANVVIWEYRKGVTRSHPGMQIYEFARDTRGVTLIATKVLSLLDCDAPQGNYSFML
ncbi:MAG: aromatic-ring-hydroxylating dioxygenase subunit beta [Burkholderiaceae bacterium]